jgi:hypothetical protein
MSKKHDAKLRAYKKAKIQRAEELKEEGKWVCIFTGHPIDDYLTGDKVPVHHLLGRDGDLMTDKKFFGFYYHSECHTAYHDKPFSALKNLWWWDGFLSRVKEIDSDLWYNLVMKTKLTDC